MPDSSDVYGAVAIILCLIIVCCCNSVFYEYCGAAIIVVTFISNQQGLAVGRGVRAPIKFTPALTATARTVIICSYRLHLQLSN